MSDIVTGPVARFGRRERRGLMLGLSGAQCAVLGVALGFMVLGMYTRGGIGFAITSPLWMPLTALALLSVRGRPMVSWLPILLHWHIRGLLGQTDYRARPGRIRPVGHLALPGDAARLRLILAPSTGSALVHDPAACSLTAIAQVSTHAFDLVDAGTQHARVDAWGRLLASFGGGVLRVQVLQRTVPETGVDLARFWAQRGVRDGSWAAHIVADLVASAPSDACHETYLAISADVPRSGAVAKAASALEGQMTAIASAAARAGLRIERWLDPVAIKCVIRTAYDPGATPTLRPDDAAIVGFAGPVAVSEEYDRLRADGAFHAVYWITEWPRAETSASFLSPLIFANTAHTLSIIATPQPTTTAARDIRKAKADHYADAGQRARLGQVGDEAMTAEYDEVVAREKELAAGHAVLDFTGLLTVSGTSSELLDAACAAMEVAASQAGCDVRRLFAQQAQAFIAAALPLGRRIT